MLDFIKAWVGTLFRDEDGAAMVEYGLLVALIAVAVIAVLLLLGPAIAALFQQVVDAL